MQNITTIKQIANPNLTSATTSTAQRPPRPWLQDLWLWILLVGPLTAPLFVWTGIPILRPFAGSIYLLGDQICPKVDVHIMFLGYPMSVCASCWFAVFGLWSVRLLFGRAGEGLGPFSRLNLAPLWVKWSATYAPVKLAVLAAGFLPWAIDVMLWDMGAWNSPQLFMMLVGYLGGLTAGMLLLPAASAMRERLARRPRTALGGRHVI